MATPRRFRNFPALAGALFILCLASISGCGSRETVPVSGVVRLNGQPVADAGIVFHPEVGPLASGVTDSSGRYSLSTGSADGARPGEYRVTIEKVIITGVREDETIAPEGIKTQYIVPQRYADRKTTDQKASVGGSGGTFDFELKK